MGEVAGSEVPHALIAKNQKTRFLPLNNFGIHTGPPAVRPY